MNIFSNVGITELVLILLLAILVLGPERLPEFSRQLAKLLRDVRKAYENLTRDLGPELAAIQQSTAELRESVEAVRSIPQEMVETVVKAAELDQVQNELQDVADSIRQVEKEIFQAARSGTEPTAAGNAHDALQPSETTDAPSEEP